MYRIIDTHAHYDSEDFDRDRELLLGSFPEKGIEKVINAGASVRGVRRGLEMAEKWPHVYCALGVHPNDIFAASAPAFEDASTAAGSPENNADSVPVWKNSLQEDLTEEVLRELCNANNYQRRSSFFDKVKKIFKD